MYVFNDNRILTIFLPLTFLLLLSIVYCSTKGALEISWQDIFLIEQNSDNALSTIWINIRLPRVLSSVCIGAMLALSGASMQGIFRNPLVDPGIIGIISGAALAATIFIIFGSTLAKSIFFINQDFILFYGLPISAFLGGWIIMLILYKLSQKSGHVSIASMLLLGIVVNAIAGAITALLIYSADDAQLRSITFWSMGSLSGVSWKQTAVLIIIMIIGSLVLLKDSSALNAMMIGENVAQHVGFDIEQIKKRQILMVSLMVGCCVAIAGGIGFIGLVIPHIARTIFGSNNKIVMPASMFIGAIILTIADTFSRTMISPAELPIGILTAILGAPFLGYLVYKSISKI